MKLTSQKIKDGTTTTGRLSKFTKEELANHYAKVVGSARVHRNRKKYHRPTDKKVGF